MDICSGSTRPLSSAMLALQCDTFSFDLLLDDSHDLLNNEAYEVLLRVAASGSEAYAAASPSCREYSRLKLRPGGPPALRTPDALDGVPSLSATDLLKVQESHLMFAACS